ncbi:hypothetical protein QBC34DRAFT_432572 [Podospora aff. communis PSN243]|uniref:SnoaL-like domain-containing protein n=1 Tax=Podospora aff. communis PSN243 TaxID=3040156 RepID=A0AAV9HB39_9PEZI|nr:hypothetical protein QBC34DRAFT_432572 [Podospora aff. communis PSN243]
MANYEAIYPSQIPTHPSVQQFITYFFKVSDTPGLNDEWVDFFCDDATLVMGSNSSTGRAEIEKLRLGMWESVAGRRHTLGKVFVVTGGFEAVDGVVEFMMEGKVDYQPRDAGAAPYSVDFAGHARLQREGPAESWRFAYYRVYLQR